MANSKYPVAWVHSGLLCSSLEEDFIRLDDATAPISEMRGLRSKQLSNLLAPHRGTGVVHLRSEVFWLFVKKLFSIITQPRGLPAFSLQLSSGIRINWGYYITS